MRTTLAWARVVLALTVFVIAAAAFDDTPSPTKLAGVINDFSPRSTMPSGPYVVSGPWSLQFHPSGSADFAASLTMVHSDLWFVETGGDPESKAARNFHTHQIQVIGGQVRFENNSIVVSGPATITGNGNVIFPGSIATIVITGGTAVARSNLTLTITGPAAAHFTNQSYGGVVVGP